MRHFHSARVAAGMLARTRQANRMGVKQLQALGLHWGIKDTYLSAASLLVFSTMTPLLVCI